MKNISLREGFKLRYLFKIWEVIEVIDYENFYIKDEDGFGVLVSINELKSDNNFKIFQKKNNKKFCYFLLLINFLKDFLKDFIFHLTRLR